MELEKKINELEDLVLCLLSIVNSECMDKYTYKERDDIYEKAKKSVQFGKLIKELARLNNEK